MADVPEYLRLLNEIDETTHGFRKKVNLCSWVEFRLMAAAQADPQLRLQDLSRQRWIYPQGVGRIARDLQRRGLVKVLSDPSDKRARNLLITKKGLKLLDHCQAVLGELLAAG